MNPVYDCVSSSSSVTPEVPAAGFEDLVWLHRPAGSKARLGTFISATGFTDRVVLLCSANRDYVVGHEPKLSSEVPSAGRSAECVHADHRPLATRLSFIVFS